MAKLSDADKIRIIYEELKATALQCAEIAEGIADSYDFPSEQAVGAEMVAVTIRRKWGLPDSDLSKRRIRG